MEVVQPQFFHFVVLSRNHDALLWSAAGSLFLHVDIFSNQVRGSFLDSEVLIVPVVSAGS